MKILVVGASMSAMMSDTLGGLAPSSIERAIVNRGRVEMKDGSTIDHVVIKNEFDADKLRGLRFDLVVEHRTFPHNLALYNLVRTMVLR